MITLAELAGVSRQAVSQYESGRASPRPEVLTALAKTLNVPESFFTRPRRSQDRGTIFYRSMSAATKGARARAEGRFSWLRDIANYLTGFVELPRSNFPDLGLPSNPLLLSDADIETAAEDTRRYWGLRDGPIGNVVRLLENQGAVIGRDLLGADTLDGLSEFDPSDQRAFIIIGTDKGSPARWRFDAAHELGHLILHQHVRPEQLRKSEEFKRIEAQAHRFAAAFLLPFGPFVDEFVAPNLDALRALKPKWKVAISMMIIRARHAGLLSEAEERKLWLSYSRRRWRTDEPYDDTMEPEEPVVLRRSFELLLREGAQTAEDVLASLALPAADVETLSGLDRGFLDSDFTPVRLLEPKPSMGMHDRTVAPGAVVPLPVRPRTS